jgi:hypothetical protein
MNDKRAKRAAQRKVLVSNLRRNGILENAELRLNFVFFADAEQAAGSLAEALAALGYSSRFGKSTKDDIHPFLITGSTTPIKMDESALEAWDDQMRALAELHKCEFSSWGGDLRS